MLAKVGAPFAGLDTATDPLQLDGNHATVALNVVPYSKYGGLTAGKLGRVQAFGASPLPAAVLELYVLNAGQYYAGINNSGTFQVYNGIPSQSFGLITPSNITLTGFNPGGVSELVNGTPFTYLNTIPPSRVETDSVGNLRVWQYSSPVTKNTFGANTAGGQLLGNYIYEYTYVGPSPDFPESSPSPVSNIQTANSEKINLTAVTVSPNGDVTARNIYRSGGSIGGTFFLVGTINDNTTTTYQDNLADSQVTGGAVVQHRDPPPATGFAHVEQHKDRAWGFNSFPGTALSGTTSGNAQLWYSNYKEFFGFDNVAGIIPVEDTAFSDSSDFGVGLASLGSVLCAFKAKSLWLILGDSPADPFLPRKVADIGCSSVRSIAKGDGLVFWLCDQGVFSFDGQSPTWLSEKIQPALDALTQAQRKSACSWFLEKTYYFSIPGVATYGYYLPTKEWHTVSWTTNLAGFDANPIKSSGFTFLFPASPPPQVVLTNNTAVAGEIDLGFTAVQDLGANLTSQWTSGTLALDQSNNSYRFRSISLSGKGSGNFGIVVSTQNGIQSYVNSSVNFGTNNRIVLSLPPNMVGQDLTASITATPLGTIVITGMQLWGWVERANSVYAT